MQGLLCAVQLGFTRKVIAETVPVAAWGGWLRPEGWGGGRTLEKEQELCLGSPVWSCLLRRGKDTTKRT